MFFKKSNKKCGLKTLCYFNVQSYAFYVKIFLLLVCLVSFIPGCNALSSVLRSSLKKGRIDSTEAKKKKKKKTVSMIVSQGLHNYSHCCALQDMVPSAESKTMPPSFWTKPRIAWGSVLYASIFVLFKPSGFLTESWLLPCPWRYIDSLLPTFLCFFFLLYWIECWHSVWNLAMHCWLNMLLFANCKNGPSHELPTFFFFFKKFWEKVVLACEQCFLL